MNVQRIDGTGKVHATRPNLSHRMPGLVFLACTGRGMRDMIGTQEPVTCGACLKRKGRNA